MDAPLQIVSFSLTNKNVSLLGEGKEKYQFLYTSEIYKTHADERLIIQFLSERDVLDFLQFAIEKKIPFFHSERAFSYTDAVRLVSEKKLVGDVIKSIWKSDCYIICE